MWKIAMNSDYFLQMIPPPNKGCWPKAHNEAVRKGILMHVASEPLLGSWFWLVARVVFKQLGVVNLLFQESPQNQTNKHSQSHIPNPGFM